MNPDPVFKAYDVRGRTDTGELDQALYKAIGSAMVEVMGFDEIAVGRDCRPTSPGFARAFGDGVVDAGGSVVDLGEVPTDAVYYYSGANRVAGAVVTASHNPPEYNGLKLCRPGALPIGAGSGLDEIAQAVRGGLTLSAREPGVRSEANILGEFVDHLFRIVGSDSIGPLAVAADGGNGMAGTVIGRVFDRIPAGLTGLYLEPDGTFPNHPADPLDPENLTDLQELMAGGGYDLGVAFDGDADRAFFLDETGSPLDGSAVTALIAQHLLADQPGESIVHNLITSKAVPELVLRAGGVPIRTRVGHSYIKAVMADSGAVFGGEHSAHFYFRDNFGADSGMLAMLHLMAIMTGSEKPLSELRREVELYSSSGEINFPVADVAGALSRVEAAVEGAEVDHLDGLTVDYGNEWFNLRPSNTEPLLRLNVEAAGPGRVSALVDYVTMLLEDS